ncbi:MAG: hypothetical protein ABIH92_02340 [Nanoarchaeota archaeon]
MRSNNGKCRFGEGRGRVRSIVNYLGRKWDGADQDTREVCAFFGALLGLPALIVTAGLGIALLGEGFRSVSDLYGSNEEIRRVYHENRIDQQGLNHWDYVEHIGLGRPAPF